MKCFRSIYKSFSTASFPSTCYGGRHLVTAIPGDGIGPEMFQHMKRVFTVAQAPVDFEIVDITDDSDIENAITSVRRNYIAIKGNLETHRFVDGYQSKNHYLRSELDLYASVTRCQTIPGLNQKHPSNIDITVIRENTEGEYSMLEHTNVPGVVESLKVVTAAKCERIANFAFEYAKNNNHSKITAVHKANIMKMTDGLFLRTCNQVAEKYPEISYESLIVDNCSMQLVSQPEQFDILLTPNLYGNIMVAIVAGLIGGPGLVPGVNIGSGGHVVFETGTRNAGKSLTGKDIANPTAYIRAGAEMLEHLGLNAQAQLIKTAVFNALSQKKIWTPDLGGVNKCSDIVESIIDDIKAVQAI